MKLSLALVTLLSASPAFASDILEEAIYRGTRVSAGGQSWKNAVNINFESEEGGSYVCTGAFIAADTMVTAAHCAVKNGTTLTIKLYKANDPNSESVEVAGSDYKFVAHPNYTKVDDADPGTNDVSVTVFKNFRLPEGFEPAPIAPASAAQVGAKVYTIGTGVNESGDFADRLMFATGSISSIDEQGRMSVSYGSQGVCGGDSGGPVYVMVNGKLHLRALHSASVHDLSDNCGGTGWENILNGARVQWINVTQARLRAAQQ